MPPRAGSAMYKAHRPRAALLVLSAAATLAACSAGTDGQATPASTAEVTARPPAPKPPGAETYATATATAEEASATPTEDVAKFGQSVDWEDGLQATVRSAESATFGQTSTSPGPGIKISVTIVNGSPKSVELFPTIDVRLGTSGATAEQVYAEGCDGLSDLGRLAPGRKVTSTLCFTGSAKTIDVSLAPTYDHNALTWTGKVA